MGSSRAYSMSRMDWTLMIDELDEDGALSLSDDSLIAMGYEDGDEDETPEIAALTEEDLFVEFAASGNIDGLRRLLEAVPDEEVPNGHEAIWEASRAGHTACVEALLDAGVVVDATTWPPRPTFDSASIIHIMIEAGVIGALENDHKSVLKILLRAGAALATETARRHRANEAAWTLVDRIRELGSWDEYVHHHRANFVSLITKMAGGAPICVVLKGTIADYVSPPGGN